MSNIITAEFGNARATKTRPIFKYNAKQILQFPDLDLPDVYEVHMCNEGDEETKTALGDSNGVQIYNEYLRTGRNVVVYIVLHAEPESRETEYMAIIPIKYRQVPGDLPPDPEQEDIIGQALDALNNSVEDAEAWAVGERGGVPVDEDDETYENSAKYWAWKAMTDAPVTSVNGKAGDIVLNLDDIPNSEQYAKTTPAQVQQIETSAAHIADIEELIPTEASAGNPLADKYFVNSIVQHFRGEYANWAAVPTTPGAYPMDDIGSHTPTRNDYIVIRDASDYPVQTGGIALKGTWRFKYSGLWATNGRNGWQKEYQIEKEPMTSAQLAALNSGVTSASIAQINANTDAIAATDAKIPADASASNQLADKRYVSTYYVSKPTQAATDAAQDARINNIKNVIPTTASETNKLVDSNALNGYRTASAQDVIDNNKQAKIRVDGILKGNGTGGIYAAVAGQDYLPTSALAAYRSANAQDVIDNAQNTEIGKNTAAINTMQPAATAADIGKALIVKTVADGKPTSYEYGEAGGGGSTLTAGDGIDITNDVISNTQGIEYIVGTQAASTASWKGNSTDETLKVGKIIAYYLPFAGSSSSNATLTLTMGNGAQTAAIPLRRTGTSAVTNQFAAGNVIILIYDGTYWRVSAYYDQNDNTVPTGYCLSPAATAAKAATCSYGYRGDTNYFPCLFRYANTATDATLAITTYAPEAAPIYVNGERTSASNTFSAGVILFLYYNGAYYCYNDGRFPILVDGTVTSVQEYAAGLLVNYRTSAAQDTIDAGKQAKITATGILKGDGAGGVSSAVAGTDYITGLEILSYGNSTWDDFLAAYTANKVVYCRASSNSNPASGSQTRMAFMAFVNDATNPTNVEFQYYRSVQTHSDSQQGDQVFVYKLDKTGGWTVTTRNTFTAIDAGTGLSKAYANGKLTLSVDGYRTAADQDVIDNEQNDRLDAVEQTTTATTIGPVAFATFNASAANMPLKGLTVNIEPVQSGSGDPSPDNVRPITGWTGCNVFTAGKNFLPDIKAQDGNSRVILGEENSLPSGNYSLFFRAGRYTLSLTRTNDVAFALFYIKKGGTQTIIAGSSSTGTKYNVVLAEDGWYHFWAYKPNGVSPSDMSDIELTLVESDYEPYQGNTYDITFPDGTVYGGTLDAVNKKLTVDRAFRTYAASEVTAQGTNTGRFNIPCPTDSIDSGKWSFSSAKLPIADRAKADLSGSVNDYCIYKRYATTTYTIKLPVTALEEARTILDGLEICYYLASPLVYDLTDIPNVLTLIGTNNIWADTGDVTVTYGAYLETVKNYADKVGDSILSAIAPLEMNYTASRAYTVGSFLFVGTKFYKVTAAISSGDTITPDTNVTQTTVAEQLMALAANA